ncbi:MAG TPA: hypothetical protein VKF15_03400 [Nitrososphaerales archaeon]|nr:hypothetical protein [Nitrososphaerales archaeon]
MALSDPLVIASLVTMDVAIYGAGIVGLLRKRQAELSPRDSEKAFSQLERSLGRAFPDLPSGYTWREALQRVEALNLDVDWTEVVKALRQYEDWRYGAMVKPEAVNPEVVRLARELSRRRTRRQSN